MLHSKLGGAGLTSSGWLASDSVCYAWPEPSFLVVEFVSETFKNPHCGAG